MDMKIKAMIARAGQSQTVANTGSKTETELKKQQERQQLAGIRSTKMQLASADLNRELDEAMLDKLIAKQNVMREKNFVPFDVEARTNKKVMVVEKLIKDLSKVLASTGKVNLNHMQLISTRIADVSLDMSDKQRQRLGLLTIALDMQAKDSGMVNSRYNKVNRRLRGMRSKMGLAADDIGEAEAKGGDTVGDLFSGLSSSDSNSSAGHGEGAGAGEDAGSGEGAGAGEDAGSGYETPPSADAVAQSLGYASAASMNRAITTRAKTLVKHRVAAHDGPMTPGAQGALLNETRAKLRSLKVRKGKLSKTSIPLGSGMKKASHSTSPAKPKKGSGNPKRKSSHPLSQKQKDNLKKGREALAKRRAAKKAGGPKQGTAKRSAKPKTQAAPAATQGDVVREKLLEYLVKTRKK